MLNTEECHSLDDQIVRCSITANGLGLGEVGELEVQMFSLAQMTNRITNVQFSTSAPILPNPCYLLPLFLFVVFNAQKYNLFLRLYFCHCYNCANSFTFSMLSI